MSAFPPEPAPAPYRGRFAPSPTGPLHFGSLVAALGSCLEARAHGGTWLIRMEDLDTPRCLPGAADSILETLAAHGFHWDEPVLWQSARMAAYRAALDRLRTAGKAYACGCSRREIADSAQGSATDGGLVYPGTCRTGLAPGKSARAWRFLVDAAPICIDDQVQGPLAQQLSRDVGDFVLLRADGLWAYQLAVVVDDAFQGINAVVRGADLLASTPRQVALQQALKLPTPRYAHLPLVVNAAGEKLSKQTRAKPLEPGQAAANLLQALDFLGQHPPATLKHASLASVWAWALENWQLSQVSQKAGMSG